MDFASLVFRTRLCIHVHSLGRMGNIAVDARGTIYVLFDRPIGQLLYRSEHGPLVLGSLGVGSRAIDELFDHSHDLQPFFLPFPHSLWLLVNVPACVTGVDAVTTTHGHAHRLVTACHVVFPFPWHLCPLPLHVCQVVKNVDRFVRGVERIVSLVVHDVDSRSSEARHHQTRNPAIARDPPNLDRVSFGKAATGE